VAGQRRPRLDLETQTPDPDSGFGARGGKAGCIGTPAGAVNAAERRPHRHAANLRGRLAGAGLAGPAGPSARAAGLVAGSGP